MDTRLLNILVLSIGFMLLFSAFQTMGNIEASVLDSIHNDNPSFTGKGYTSLAIIYAVFATINWLVPSFISLTGPRVSILFGALCYTFFISTFLWPQTVLLYVASALVGAGGALIWTGHGQYLTENSDSETMARNSGLFWAIFQLSLLAGNLCVFFVFTEGDIKESKRKLIFQILTSLAVTGTCILFLMRKPPQMLALQECDGVSSADEELRIPDKPREKPLLAAWHAIRDAFQLFITPQSLLLSITFFYTGIELTFLSAVYSTSIGNTREMGGQRKRYVSLSGIFIGLGEIIGGALFGFFGSKVKVFSGTPVVITGFSMHILTFLIALINLPNEASFQETERSGFITPSPTLAFFGSLMLGFGDACFNTQIYSSIGTLHAKDSAPAFALFKFWQSVAAALSFFYSLYIGLHIQIGLLFVTLSLGTLTFCMVNLKSKRTGENDCPVLNYSLSDNTVHTN